MAGVFEPMRLFNPVSYNMKAFRFYFAGMSLVVAVNTAVLLSRCYDRPERSPDLTPMDFFLGWGQKKVYAMKLKTINN